MHVGSSALDQNKQTCISSLFTAAAGNLQYTGCRTAVYTHTVEPPHKRNEVTFVCEWCSMWFHYTNTTARPQNRCNVTNQVNIFCLRSVWCQAEKCLTNTCMKGILGTARILHPGITIWSQDAEKKRRSKLNPLSPLHLMFPFPMSQSVTVRFKYVLTWTQTHAPEMFMVHMPTLFFLFFRVDLRLLCIRDCCIKAKLFYAVQFVGGKRTR